MFKRLRARWDFHTYVVASLPATCGMFVQMFLLKSNRPLELVDTVWAPAATIALVAIALAFTNRTTVVELSATWDLQPPFVMGCKHGELFFRIKRSADDDVRWLIEVRKGAKGSWTRVSATVISKRTPTANEVLDAYVLSRFRPREVLSGH